MPDGECFDDAGDYLSDMFDTGLWGDLFGNSGYIHTAGDIAAVRQENMMAAAFRWWSCRVYIFVHPKQLYSRIWQERVLQSQ